jgi:hypothetical protein
MAATVMVSSSARLESMTRRHARVAPSVGPSRRSWWKVSPGSSRSTLRGLVERDGEVCRVQQAVGVERLIRRKVEPQPAVARGERQLERVESRLGAAEGAGHNYRLLPVAQLRPHAGQPVQPGVDWEVGVGQVREQVARPAGRQRCLDRVARGRVELELRHDPEVVPEQGAGGALEQVQAGGRDLRFGGVCGVVESRPATFDAAGRTTSNKASLDQRRSPRFCPASKSLPPLTGLSLAINAA